jgi:hypothetical protein
MSSHIKGILNEFMEKKGEERKTQEKIKKVITEVLGEKFLKHITIKGVHKKKVVVRLSSSVAQYEAGLKKTKLYTALKKEFPYLEEIKLTIK